MFQCCILYTWFPRCSGYKNAQKNQTDLPATTTTAAAAAEKILPNNQPHESIERLTVFFFLPARLHAKEPIVFMLSTEHASLKSKRLIIFGCFSMAFISFISGRTCRKHHSFVTVAAAGGVVVVAVVVLVVTVTNVCFSHVCRLPFFNLQHFYEGSKQRL